MKLLISVLTVGSMACLSRADIIVTGGWLNTISSAWGPGLTVNDIKSDVPANSLEKTVTSTLGGVVDNTTYDFAVSGSTGHLATSFNTTAAAVAGQYGEPHNQGEIDFTVTGAPVNYFISGNFAVTGASGEAITTGLWTGKTNLFNNFQSSNSTPDENLILGEMGGDVSNSLSGSLTGVLGVGSYIFAYSTDAQTYQGGSLTDDGVVRIDFGSPAPAPSPESVPEPDTVAFLGIGLLGMFAMHRRMLARRGA